MKITKTLFVYEFVIYSSLVKMDLRKRFFIFSGDKFNYSVSYKCKNNYNFYLWIRMSPILSGWSFVKITCSKKTFRDIALMLPKSEGFTTLNKQELDQFLKKLLITRIFPFIFVVTLFK